MGEVCTNRFHIISIKVQYMFLNNSAEKLETKAPEITKSGFPKTTNIAKAP